jgi:hypothetical protein
MMSPVSRPERRRVAVRPIAAPAAAYPGNATVGLADRDATRIAARGSRRAGAVDRAPSALDRHPA